MTPLVLAPCAVAADEATFVETVDGSRFPADRIAVRGDWQVSFIAKEGTRTLNAAELICWGRPAEPKWAAATILRNGLFVGRQLAADGSKVSLSSALCGDVTLSRALVTGVVLRSPAERASRDRLLARIRDERRPADLLLLENGDELSGRFLRLTEEVIEFEAGLGHTVIDRRRVIAIAFGRSDAQDTSPVGLRAWVGLEDGSLFVASRLVVDERQARFTVAGADDAAPWTAPASAVRFVEPLGGRATYVTEALVEDYRHIPYLGISWPYRIDRSVGGGPLRVAGRLYPQGIGQHSASRLTLRLDKPYKRFEAEIAVDDETSGGGSVVFRVFQGATQLFASGIVRGGMPPQRVSIELSGTGPLSLVVDHAEQGDVLDHADWPGARLIE